MQKVENRPETLTYSCPHCHEVMDVSSHLANETINCVRCDKPFHADAPHSKPLDPVKAKKESRRHHHASKVVESPADDENTVYNLHPSMFRNHPLIFLGVSVMLILGILGMLNYALLKGGVDLGDWTLTELEMIQSQTLFWVGIILTTVSGLYLLGWRIQTWFVTLKITTERSIYQRGLISRRMSEVRHDDVRNLMVNQSFIQRLLRVGTLAVSSSGQDDFEITVKGMPDPGKLAETIRHYQ